MRKAYEQPKLYAESFELLEHISACSGYAAGLNNARTADSGCAYEFEGFALFDTTWSEDGKASKCNFDGGNAYDDSVIDSWMVTCYNNPEGGINGHPFGS